MTKTYILLAMILLIMPLSYAMVCKTSISEYLPTQSIDYVCQNVSADSCFVTILINDSPDSLVVAAPEQEMGNNYVSVGFPVNNNMSIIRINTKDIKVAETYNFTFHCGLNNYTTAFNPSYESLMSIPRGAISVNDNLLRWLITAIVAVLVLIGAGIFISTIKGRS